MVTEWFREYVKWAVHDIPDPNDTDPLRYAILTGLVEVLAFGFNQLVSIDLPRGSPAVIHNFEILAAQPKKFEIPPEWALKVAPLAEKVFVPNEKGWNNTANTLFGSSIYTSNCIASFTWSDSNLKYAVGSLLKTRIPSHTFEWYRCRYQ